MNLKVWGMLWNYLGSISYLQRNLEIGYNRARIIVKLLELEKVITTSDKNGIRKIIKKQ